MICRANPDPRATFWRKTDPMPLTLAFDSSAPHCAAAVMQGDRVLAVQSVEMARGQAENLFSVIQSVLTEAGVTLDQITRINVGVGPGNFTGIRISVAAARGLALSLNVPAIGVSTFQAIHLHDPSAIAAVPAPRGMINILRAGAEQAEQVSHADEPGATLPPAADQLVIDIARIAATAQNVQTLAPVPLYLRPADAAPPRDAPPVIVP